MTYSGGPYAAAAYASAEEAETTGPVAGIDPAPVPRTFVANGPIAPPGRQQPIRPAPIDRPVMVSGPLMPPVGSPLHPGTTDPEYLLTVEGEDALDASCQVTLNDIGSGSYKVPLAAAPVVGIEAKFNLAGQRILTGPVTKVDSAEVSDGEESDEQAQVTVAGRLTEWSRTILHPAFGASNTDRLGPPSQDTRIWDWSARAHRFDTREGLDSLAKAVAFNSLYHQNNPEAAFPLPDVWPTADSPWMWGTDPMAPAPSGWVYFRAPFLATPRMQFWLCAYDYAELWVDGVPIVTAGTVGKAERIELEMEVDDHLAIIRAYNQSGRAGVMMAAMGMGHAASWGLGQPPPSTNPSYESMALASGAGWRVLAYPARSFRSSPGAVLFALRNEAFKRGSIGGRWDLTCTYEADSAGRPWPPGPPISLEVGSSYLDVLKELAVDRIDFAVSPAKREIDVWVKDLGSGSDLGSPWTKGVDMLSASEARTS